MLEVDYVSVNFAEKIRKKLDLLLEKHQQRHLWSLFMIHVESGTGYTILISEFDVDATLFIPGPILR